MRGFMQQLGTAAKTASASQYSVEVPFRVMDVIKAVEKNDSSLLNQSIASLIDDADQIGLPKPFLADTKQSLDSGNWDRFAKGLQNLEFLGEDAASFCWPLTPHRARPRKRRSLAPFMAAASNSAKFRPCNPSCWICLEY